MNTLILILKKMNVLIFAGMALTILNGCAGTKVFHEEARAGDTIAVATGWKKTFTRDAMTVTITGSDNNQYVYLPNDPAVRAVVNLYPDPLSSILVSPRIGFNLTPYAQTYASSTNIFTNGDPDWWQTTVFVDLPTNMALGTGFIQVSTPAGESALSSVNIVPGTGIPGTFDAQLNGPMTPVQLSSLERVPNKVVSFSGSTIPYAVEVRLSHAPDAAHSGSGYVHVVNPRGDLKSTTWYDNGTELRVMLLPAKQMQQTFGKFTNLKFYVSGGVTGLSIVSVSAFDNNGSPVSGVSASIN